SALRHQSLRLPGRERGGDRGRGAGESRVEHVRRGRGELDTRSGRQPRRHRRTRLADLTADEYLDRLRALLPAVRERAQRAEQLRRLPDETFKDFQAAGLLRCLQPKRYAGYELDPGTFYRGVMDVAAVCGSSGWVLAVLGIHNWHLAL